MPVSYSFEGRIVAMRLDGVYTPQDLKGEIVQALDDTACPPEAVLLFDQRQSESIEQRSQAEFRDMTAFLALHGARFGNRMAMVAPSDVAYGMLRIAAVYVEQGGIEPAVFRDMDEARVWLLA